MSKLRRRKEKDVSEMVEEVKEAAAEGEAHRGQELDFSKVVSTGSTLLDLAISGKRVRGGGIPGGILVEVFGPPSSGKTAILAEICASAQARGGEVMILDPEARFDKEYARIYGVTVNEEHYYRPDTVTETFTMIRNWRPKRNDVVNVVACDSLAALSTEMELEEGDKRGMRRAKEFSQELRKVCRLIANNGWLVVCSNQVREGDFGEFTPGGKAIPFYSSVRIRVAQRKKLVKRVRLSSGKEVQKVVGIESEFVIKKSSIDDPFREGFLYIVFGYGIDDVRANLQYIKDMEKLTKYRAVDREFQRIDDAIRYVEENNLYDALREEVINLWEEVEKKFETARRPKPRR